MFLPGCVLNGTTNVITPIVFPWRGWGITAQHSHPTTDWLWLRSYLTFYPHSHSHLHNKILSLQMCFPAVDEGGDNKPQDSVPSKLPQSSLKFRSFSCRLSCGDATSGESCTYAQHIHLRSLSQKSARNKLLDIATVTLWPWKLPQSSSKDSRFQEMRVSAGTLKLRISFCEAYLCYTVSLNLKEALRKLISKYPKERDSSDNQCNLEMEGKQFNKDLKTPVHWAFLSSLSLVLFLPFVSFFLSFFLSCFLCVCACVFLFFCSCIRFFKCLYWNWVDESLWKVLWCSRKNLCIPCCVVKHWCSHLNWPWVFHKTGTRQWRGEVALSSKSKRKQASISGNFRFLKQRLGRFLALSFLSQSQSSN